MDLDAAILGRRSIRSYGDKKVDDATIKKIIEAGTWAPSACNIQGWKFLVIDEPEIFQSMLKHGAASFLKSVRKAILVLYENTTDNLEYNDYIQSAGACIQNMLLEAYSLGVGTCWVNFLPEKSVLRKILHIPNSYDPIALITLGYIDKPMNEMRRKYTIDDLIAYNRFSFKHYKEKAGVKLHIKRILRKLYLKFPCKKLVMKFLDKHEKKFNN